MEEPSAQHVQVAAKRQGEQTGVITSSVVKCVCVCVCTRMCERAAHWLKLITRLDMSRHYLSLLMLRYPGWPCKVTGADRRSICVTCTMKHFGPTITRSCCFREARSSSHLMVDVPGPLPADPLLTPALSARCLRGTHNEENRKLNTRPQSTSLNHFLLLSIKARENTAAGLLRNQSHGSQWGAQVSVVFTGWDIPTLTRF